METRRNRPDPCPTHGISGPIGKRKFRSPHHIFGSQFIDPREFALLEKKICGEHRSKKRRNGAGLAPRTPSKQVIYDILSNKNPAMSWFSAFLSSEICAVDFMQGPFRNPDKINRTLKAFTCFGKLPREIQDLVWEYALPARRLVSLR